MKAIIKARLLLAVAAMAGAATMLRAQDGAGAAPVSEGGFEHRGSLTAGYRFAAIKGYRPMYSQLFNLRPGPRLLDFNLSGAAKQGGSGFADSYSISASGLGGEPFPAAQITVRKQQWYDFRASWRQSYYVWNQNDSVLLPIVAVSGLSTGLTNNHDWSTVRKNGAADLTLHATNHLRFSFAYSRMTNAGDVFTTRTMDFFGSPAFWGNFARSNPYYLMAPLEDQTNRVTGGMDYTYASWNFHYRLGYQTFQETSNLDNVSSPEISINGVAASLRSPLTSLSASTIRRLTTPVSEFSFSGKAGSRAEWRGGYIAYRYRGPASLDESFSGIAPNSAGVAAAYSVSQGMRASVSEPNHIVNQGVTYHLSPRLDASADYRYSRLSANSTGTFHSLFNGTAQSTGQTQTEWRYGLHDLELEMIVTPLEHLVVRPGIRLMKADVEELQNGAGDPARSKRINTVWPELSVGYEPSRLFSIRGGIQSVTNGASYTATMPRARWGTHWIARFQPSSQLSVENDLNIGTSKLVTSAYRNTFRSNTLTVSYAWNDRFSALAGFTYGSFFAQGNVSYVRGTPPLNELLRDQEIHRLWQAGVEAKPIKRFGMRFTMNFERTTGAGQIGNEPPAYGPLTWPVGAGTFYFDFPNQGRLSLDLQRTYYKEEILAANNFSANVLVIRWTQGF